MKALLLEESGFSSDIIKALCMASSQLTQLQDEPLPSPQWQAEARQNTKLGLWSSWPRSDLL